MLIYITDTENQRVVVEFTDEELQHERFHQSTNGILNKYNGVKHGNTMILSPKKAQKKDNIGILINDIREDLICDVLADEDPKKDLSKSPFFNFTPHQTQEPGPLIKKPVNEKEKNK